jgi:hypothetical protein
LKERAGRVRSESALGGGLERAGRVRSDSYLEDDSVTSLEDKKVQDKGIKIVGNQRSVHPTTRSSVSTDIRSSSDIRISGSSPLHSGYIHIYIYVYIYICMYIYIYIYIYIYYLIEGNIIAYH